jgi:NADPH-dependent 2,4-dienoyl-CoA reductase/sulfur reductase-like enzyme
MTSRSGVAIVGASAAGLAVAEALRHGGYDDRVTLIGAEEYLPYDRPPLSKQVLAGTWIPEQAQLASPTALSDLDLEFALGQPAVSLNPDTYTVHTSDREFAAAHIVLATGASPLTLPGQSEISGVHVLRTLDQAAALRKDLLRAGRVVIVGDGVLGTEIAATANSLGAAVTLVGARRLPMMNQLGDTAAQLLADVHAEAGVTVRAHTTVEGLEARDGAVTAVTLGTGETVAADVVVVAVGVTPATQWLASSGLELHDGVVCDSRCRAAEGIYAVGDVARFYHQDLGSWVRLENRTNATEQAAVVADNILGGDTIYRPVPYFWTDQYTHRIQLYGSAAAGAAFTVVDGSLTQRRFVGCWQHNGQITAVLGWNMPKQARIRRQQMATENSTVK